LTWKFGYWSGNFRLVHAPVEIGWAKMNSASLETGPEPPAEPNSGADCVRPQNAVNGFWICR
jgi:hypothetical protein